MRCVALIGLLVLAQSLGGCQCGGPPLRTTGGDLPAAFDAGARADAGPTDAGPTDAGAPDAGPSDADSGFTHPAGIVVARVPLPGAFGVAVSPAGLIYVTSVTEAAVAHGDVATRTFSPLKTPVSPVPVRVLFTSDGRRAFVAHQNSSAGPITVLDTATHLPLATVDTPGGVVGIARSTQDGRAFFGLVNTASLFALTPVAGAYDARAFPAVGTSIATVGLAFDEARNALYGTNDGHTVFRYDFPSGADAQALSLPAAAPKQVAYDARTSTLYVANEAGDLLVFQAGARALTPLPFATVGGASTQAFGIALTPDGKELWLSDSNAGALRIVNLASREVRVVGGVGRPRDIAFDASGSTAVVADEQGTVLFLR